MPFTCCPKKETPEMGSGTDTTRRPKTQVFASVSTITKVSFPERVFAPAAATWAQADLVLGQGVVQGVVQDLLVDGAHGLDGVVVIAVCDLEGFPVLEAADDGHVVEVDFHLRKEAALNSGCSAWRKSGLSISVRSWAMSGPLSDSVLGFVESDNKKGTASWNKQTVLVVLVWSLVAVVLSMWLHKAWSTRERRERWPEKGRSGPSHEREGRVHGRGSTREKAPPGSTIGEKVSTREGPGSAIGEKVGSVIREKVGSGIREKVGSATRVTRKDRVQVGSTREKAELRDPVGFGHLHSVPDQEKRTWYCTRTIGPRGCWCTSTRLWWSSAYRSP
jgi:hypothetical protein